MNRIDNNSCNLFLEDGILYVEYKIENLTIDVAHDIVKTRIDFTEGKSYPIFVDISKLKVVSKESRDFLSQGPAVEGLKAAAFFGASFIARVIINLFLAFNKPQLPTKSFGNKEEAIKWLQKFK